MVKSKLRKKSARVSIKPKSKEQQIKKQNPFDLKFNRAKHAVLGRKTIGAIGKPTASKKKALEHREKTLLKEYKAFGKTNKIVDNRIGEYDVTLTEEQKAYKRFAEERKISGTKGNKYDLNEEEGEVTLTHGGRALTQVEKYDKTMVSDDEDDDFGAEMVEKVHFGGGNQATTNVSKKDLITELIARSKQTKMEKQNIKDEQEAITETLDEKLKRLMERGALDKGVGGRKTKETATVEKDNYDTLLDTLRTSEDPRVKAGDRRKSEAEEAEEERERLAKLESDRLLRHNTHANESTHFSVDDDAPRPKKKQSMIMELKYDSEGRAVTSHTVEKASIMRIGPEDDETSEEDGDEDDERVREEMEEGLDEMFDMESEDEGEGESAEKERQEELEKKRRGTKNIKGKKCVAPPPKGVDSVPFVFQMPRKYADLVAILAEHSQHTELCLQRMIACFHPSLAEENKAHLKHLFLLTLRYYDETAREVPTPEKMRILEDVAKGLRTLIKLVREHGVQCVRALLRSHWRKLHSSTPPTFSLPATLRLVHVLFPTGDIWHPVCTPAFLVACRALSRYIPEAMNFLLGCFQMAVPAEQGENPSTIVPMKSKLLLITQAVKKSEEVRPLAPAEVFGAQGEPGSLDDTPIARSRLLNVCLTLLRKFSLLYLTHEDTYSIVFRRFLSLLRALPAQLYPRSVQEEVQSLIQTIEENCEKKSQLVQLVKPRTEAKMLEMLEPRLEDEFYSKNDQPKQTNITNERKKIKRLISKEKRGAVKELRKDTSFLAKKRQSEQLRLDKERSRKTKRIMASLQTQQSEHKKMEIKKKHQKD